MGIGWCMVLVPPQGSCGRTNNRTLLQPTRMPPRLVVRARCSAVTALCPRVVSDRRCKPMTPRKRPRRTEDGARCERTHDYSLVLVDRDHMTGIRMGIDSCRGPSLPRDLHRRDRLRRDDHRTTGLLRWRRGRPSDGQRKRITGSVTCAAGTATLPALAADATLLACPSLAAAAADADACVVTPPGACIMHAGIQPAWPAGFDVRHVVTAASNVGDTCASCRSRARARGNGTTTCGAAKLTLHTDDACTAGRSRRRLRRTLQGLRHHEFHARLLRFHGRAGRAGGLLPGLRDVARGRGCDEHRSNDRLLRALNACTAPPFPRTLEVQ
ncbi:MAG: hypothetical protein JWL95_3193 [Gemmatimonadetes bacterium]|nr:hypothetical protein [Gemmatimonadota bacterium]